MNIITNIFESFYRYAVRNEIVIKIILVIEMISIFSELTLTVAKSNGVDVINSNYSNFGQNYSLYIQYISPYFLLKNINDCKTINSKEFCYFSDNYFLIIAIIILFLFLIIVGLNFKKDIYFTNLEDIGISYYLKKLMYNFVDFIIFKIFSFSLFYLFINKIITSLILYINEDIMNIFYCFLSLTCIILFILSNFCYIKYFNLIIQVEDSYHHDNMLSINYDFYLLILKIVLSIENCISRLDKDFSLQLRIINYIILLFSLLFSIYILYCCSYSKIMFIMNFSLNRIRICLIMFLNINILIYFFLYSPDYNYEQFLLTILIFVCILMLSIIITDKIIERNISILLFSDQLVLIVLYLIHEKYASLVSNDLTSNTINKIFDKKQYTLSKINFDSKIHSLYLNHKYKCNMQSCHICNIKCLSFENLLHSFEKQIETMINDIRYKNRFSVYSLQCLEFLKLLCIQNNEKQKKVKLLYRTKKSMITNRKNYSLLNNIVIFFTYINREIISSRKFVLLKNYYDTNNFFKDIIEHLEDIIISYIANDNKDLNKTIYDVNYLKEKIDTNVNYFVKFRSTYVDEYNLTIIKYLYEILFNSKSNEFLCMYNLDVMEDKLEQYYSVDRMMVLDFATETNVLKILRSSHEFNEYNNGRFALMFPVELRKAAEDELINEINKSDNLSFKFEYISNNYNYIRIFKLLKGYILPSIKENYLMITSEYDVDDTEILLLEGHEDLKYDINNIGKFLISNFSLDLGEKLFLKPRVLKIIQSTKYVWKTQVDQFFNISTTNSNDIHITFCYKKYLEVYKNLFDIIKEFPDYMTDEKKKLFKSNMINISKYASEGKKYIYKMNKAIEKKTGFRKFIAVKIIQDISSRDQEDASILQDKNFNDSRLGTVITASSTKSLTSTSNKKLTETNNDNLSRYTKCTLIFNICLIIYCLMYLIIGINNNKRFDRLYETRIKFLSVMNNIQHTYLSLFFSIYIMDENKNKTYHVHDNRYNFNLHDYVISEVTNKINFVTDVITEFESKVFAYNYNDRLKDLFNLNVDYDYLAIIDGKVMIRRKSSNFLYILKQFANNCKVIDQIKSKSLIMYLVNTNNNELIFPKFVNVNEIPRYIFTMYELILNYNKYLNLIAYVEDEINQEHLDNMKILFMVNFNLTLILILVHFVLIFICYRIIITIKTILTDNNKIVNNIMKSDHLKFIKTKFSNLKKLTELYAINPVTLFNNLRENASEYQRIIKLNNSKENKNSKNNNPLHDKNFQFKINNKKIITNFSSILIVTFVIYFIYSIILYLIFYLTYVNIQNTTDYLFKNSQTVNAIYNNAVMLKTSMILNRTDFDISRDFDKNENAEYGYIQQNINKFFELENSLKKSRLSPAVKKHYEKYENDIMDCDLNYELFEDLLITKTTENNPELLKGIINVCRSAPIMKTDIDQLFNDIMYSYQKILIQYNSSRREYKKVKNIFKEDSILENVFILLLFVYRPIEVYITLIINTNTIKEVNNNYLFFTFIYLSLNIFVDIFLCVIIYQLILKKTAVINKYYNSLIGCLKV